MDLADLLQWLSNGRKDGTLEIRGVSGVIKNIYFKSGKVMSSSSNDPREYLGQYLMSHGHITEDELTKAMEVQRESSILLGKILVMINAITEEDLSRLMVLKAEESIYEIFLWEEGEFEFHDGRLPDMPLVPMSLDVTGVTMEGLRRFDEWRRLRQVISSSALVPVLTRALGDSVAADRDRIVAAAIDGRRSITEIALQTRVSEFVASKLVYDLVQEGGAVLTDARPTVEEVAADLTGPFDLDDTGALFLRKGRKLMAANQLDSALRVLQAASNVSTSQDIKTALAEAEDRMRTQILSDGITFNKVPMLKKSINEITEMKFTPNEGFIISRINGRWDIKSILQISPMRELDALLILRKLLNSGVLELQDPPGR